MTGRSSRFGLRLLDFALWPLRRMKLGRVMLAVSTHPLRQDLPVLVAANHTSWWDGFLMRDVHERLRPRDPFCVVMTDRELTRRPWLRPLGAVGLTAGSVASVRRTLRELQARRERDARTFFVFFPQGAIWPSTRRPLGFQPGVELLVRMLAPVILVPAAIHIEPLNGPVPVPFVSLGEPMVVGHGETLDANTVESMVEHELDSVLSFLQRHGENAMNAWPAFRRAGIRTAEHR